MRRMGGSCARESPTSFAIAAAAAAAAASTARRSGRDSFAQAAFTAHAQSIGRQPIDVERLTTPPPSIGGSVQFCGGRDARSPDIRAPGRAAMEDFLKMATTMAARGAFAVII